jgi:hypothetical protein
MKTVFPVQIIVTPLPQFCRLPRCSLRGQLGEDRVGVGMRDWSPDREKMGKGVTLSREDLLALKELLNKIEL